MQITLKRHANGTYRSRIGGMMFMLEKEHVEFEAGYMIEGDFMIVRPMHSRLPEGGFDYASGPYGYLVRPVLADDVLIEHKGFECSGSMCSTLAMAKHEGQFRSISPGRLMDMGGHYTAENVNANFFKSPAMPVIGGRCYVKLSALTSGGVMRSEGVPDMSNLDHHVRKFSAEYAEWKVRYDKWHLEREAKRLGLVT